MILLICLVAAAICAINAWTGWQWTKLDHNPWMGKPLGGMFSGMVRPGPVPSLLSVEQINARGWMLLTIAPIVFLVLTLSLLLLPV